MRGRLPRAAALGAGDGASRVAEGRHPSAIAVLYRAHYHARELQMELSRHNIDYQITSGVRRGGQEGGAGCGAEGGGRSGLALVSRSGP